MEEVRGRFVTSATCTEWTRAVGEAMAKAMDSEIIQINTQLSEELNATNISNTKEMTLRWTDRLLERGLEFTIGSARAYISREKAPLTFTVWKK